MAADPDNRVPLTLLGGFLGSGKTTWLRHQIHDGRMAGSLVVVNEAADVPVDDMLLSRASGIRTLAGGCACCEGREALIALLRDVCNRRVAAAGEGCGPIVLETSGLADPGPIGDAIRTNPVLTHHLKLSKIIVAVDAVNGLDYLSDEPLGRRQVETADRLIVTKADAAEVGTLCQLRATLEAMNPAARLSAASMGVEVPLPAAGNFAPVAMPVGADADARPVISTALRLAPGTDWTAFGVWLSALLHVRGDDLVRVKGVVRTPSGRLLLQSVRRVVQSPEILPNEVTAGKDENRIVFIGRGFRPRDLATSMRRFAGLSVEEERGPRQ